MKLAILYHSESGNTELAAKQIAAGAISIPNTEVRCISLNQLTPEDEEYLEQSSAVIFGTPTYVANMSWKLKQFFDTKTKLKLSGKLGAAFATENFANGGGGELAIMNIMSHMLVKGMLCYSSGVEFGQPYIHIGPTLVRGHIEEKAEHCKIFGQRVAWKAHQLFDRLGAQEFSESVQFHEIFPR